MKKLFSLCVLLFAVHCLAQNQVNPATQVRWPAVSGTVDPASPTWPCATANYGQPYTNTTSGDAFFCGSTGWKKAGGGGTVQPTRSIACSFSRMQGRRRWPLARRKDRTASLRYCRAT